MTELGARRQKRERRARLLRHRQRSRMAMFALMRHRRHQQTATRTVYERSDRIAKYEEVRSSPQWKRLYRVTPRRFDYILKKLGWKWEKDAGHRFGPHPAVKLMCAISQLTQDAAPVQVAGMFGMGETTADTCLRNFCDDMIEKFSYYLKPDWKRSLRAAKRLGIDGYLGSLDCSHILWHGCPRGDSAAFKDRDNNISIILESLVDADLMFTHHYFGQPGSVNDINVLHGSPLLTLFEFGKYPQYDYTLAGESFEYPYILVDGIYPKWAVFAKTLKTASTAADEAYKDFQEARRKQVECAFGILKRSFKSLWGYIKKRDFELICKMVKVCLILYNMRRLDKVYFKKLNLKKYKKALDKYERKMKVQEPPIEFTPEVILANRARMTFLENVQEHERLQQALKTALMQK